MLVGKKEVAAVLEAASDEPLKVIMFVVWSILSITSFSKLSLMCFIGSTAQKDSYSQERL
jgi:hypothetical protein